MDKNKRPTKLTLTYEDGSSESWDTFIAIGVEGLIPIDVRDGIQTYMSSEKMRTRCTSRVVGDISIYSALIMGIRKILLETLEKIGPAAAALVALDSIRMEESSKADTLYSETQIIDRHSEQN